MSNHILIEAADVGAPSSVFCRATVTSSERIAIPSSMSKRFVTFQAQTSAVFIAFGTGSITASASATASLSSEVPTAAATSTILIAAGTEKTFRIPSSVTHFAHISADTSGFLRFFNSTGPGEV